VNKKQLDSIYDKYKINEDMQIYFRKPVVVLSSKPESHKLEIDRLAERCGLDIFEIAVIPYVKNPTDHFVNAKVALAEIGYSNPIYLFQMGLTKPLLPRSIRFSKAKDVDSKKVLEIREAFEFRAPNLHHHDHDSLRDGLGKVDDLLDRLDKEQIPFCSVTNHGRVGGWIDQYRQCKKRGIKPIFGMEAYLNDYRDNVDEKTLSKVEQKALTEVKKQHRKNYHLTLLAKNQLGWANIIRIHNDAHLKGFYYVARCNHEACKKWGSGIIAMSGCLSGEIASLLMQDKFDEAKAAYEFYRDCFDEFYIELVMVDIDDQVEANRRLVKAAKEWNAPVVVTSDSHYANPEDYESHFYLLLMRDGKTEAEYLANPEGAWHFSCKDVYWKNSKQAYKLFLDKYQNEDYTEEVFQEGIRNAREIALEIESYPLDSSPKVPILYDDGIKVLREKVEIGFKKRYPKATKNYRARLEYEMRVIEDKGFADYMLIIDDIYEYCRKHTIPVGWGRGSSASSIVCFCLNITDVCPMENGLIFERFLDPEASGSGVGMYPDIDVDLDPRYRDEVKRYIVDKYGEKNTCTIGTYVKMLTRTAILDVARVMGIPPAEVFTVTKSLQSYRDDDDDSDIEDLDIETICENHPQLAEFFDRYPGILPHVKRMRGNKKTMGRHAAGMVVSDRDLVDSIPVCRIKSGDSYQIVSAWSESGDYAELSDVGYIKFDFLGLTSVTIIDECLKMIAKTSNKHLTRDRIPLDDHKAIETCQTSGLGIFQLESPVTKPVLQSINATSFKDIVVAESLIRPGPKDMGMHLTYGARKAGKESYEIHPLLQEVLGSTYGIVVFQEQIQKISQVIAGFSKSLSRKFLKTLAKKHPEEAARFRVQFVEGSRERIESGEISVEEVNRIFDLCESFAKYGFNCLALDSVLETPDGPIILGDVEIGQKVKFPIDNEQDGYVEVIDVIDRGKQDVYEVMAESGNTIRATMNHKFLCEDGEMHRLSDIIEDDLRIMCEDDS